MKKIALLFVAILFSFLLKAQNDVSHKIIQFENSLAPKWLLKVEK